MAMTGKKIKVGTEETKAGRKEDATPFFPRVNDSAIWHNVFDKLDPQDKLTFSRADSEWHDLVDSKRTQFLYPEVAPIIPESRQCRELCKLWSLEWDRRTVTHPSNLSLNFETVAPEMWNISKYVNKFHYAEEIQQFLQDMKNHPGNPFPGKRISLEWFDLPADEDRERSRHDYANSLMLLLEKFGTHVHYCRITLRWIYGDGYDNKTLLRNVLVHLPHLRKLDICELLFENDIDNRSLTDKFYRRNPLPLLENLETLVFHGVGPEIINSVLNFCCVASAIKRLYLGYDLKYYLGNFETVHKFVNLEVLRAPLFIQDLEGFSSQRGFPPLRELSLQWMKRPNFQRLLKALEPFENSLQYLKMGSILVASGHHVEPRTINLPNLSELSISCYEGPLDPLVQLTALTEINLFNVRNPHRPRQMLGLFELEQQMKKSNIWGLIPSLKEFSLCHKTFYRSDVEKPGAGEGKTSK